MADQPTKKNTKLQQRLEEMEAGYKRALADYQNLVKQTAKERQEYIKFANTELLMQFLPILDHLQAAYQHLQDQGLEMIIKQCQQILAKEQIEEIKPQPGDQFDEHLHEAIDAVEIEDPNQLGHIAAATQAGYRYHEGQVLRHAKVKVYKSPKQ